MQYALVNEHGLNEGVLEMDERSAAAHPMRPGWRLLPVPPAVHNTLGFLGHAARHQHEIGWHLLPVENVRKWTRARGHGADQVLEHVRQHDQHVSVLQATGMLNALAAVPEDVEIPTPPPCIRRFPIPAIEIQPDLWIREMTEQESLEYAEELVKANFWPDDYARLRIATWYDDPDCWPITVAWRGQPLQYESYHFHDSSPNTVRAGFNVRLRSDRPYFFWRQVFAPFFQHLRSLGITTMQGRIRKNRADFIDALIETYDAEVVGGDDKWVDLRYSLERAVALASGWPERPTAGVGWSWHHEATGLVLREMADDELPSIRGQLATLWGRDTHPAVPIVQRLLDERYALDRARVLVAEADQAICGVFLLRHRRGQDMSAAILTPYGDPAVNARARVLYRGVLEWAYDAGYRQLFRFIPDATYDHPGFRRSLQHARAEIVHRRADGFIVVAHDLEAIHNEPVADWEQWQAMPDWPDSGDVPASLTS